MRRASSGAFLASLALLVSVLSSPASAQDVPADGFALTPLPYPAPGATATLANGDFVSFDGATVARYDAAGSLVAVLGTFTPAVFTGALALDPSETFALLGESSNGDVFRVALDGSGMTFLANLPFNYDADFESGTSAIVSAAQGGFFTGNDLVRLDTTSGATQLLAHLSGSSGPVAIDNLGNLFYATQDPAFPPPAGSTSVVFFTPAQLNAGVLLGDADPFLFCLGFDGGISLAYDEARNNLYLSETNFDVPTNRIRLVGPSQTSSPTLVAGDPFLTGSNLEFLEGDGVARFLPYQPATGGRLVYSTTDFGAVNERKALDPARPVASVAGPGTSGPGTVTFDVAGAHPGGTFLVVFGPQATYGPLEVALFQQGSALPLFTGLATNTLGFVPFFLPVDASGAGSFTFYNPGGLENLLVLQALIGDASAKTLGTSTAAFL